MNDLVSTIDGRGQGLEFYCRKLPDGHLDCGYSKDAPFPSIDFDKLKKIDPLLYINGNLYPKFDRQDDVCSEPAEALNKCKETQQCCKEHDRCYELFGCNASSWVSTAYWATTFISPIPTLCAICNLKATACVLKNAGKL